MQIPILTPAYRRIRAFAVQIAKTVRVFKVFGMATAVELDRVGVLDRKGAPSRLRIAWRAFYLIVFVLVVLLPTWKDEPVPYFAALLALGGAWLIAVPQLSRELRSIDLSSVSFGAETWQALRQGLTREKIDFPTLSPEEEKQLANMVPPLVRTALPMALLDIMLRLAWRAVALSMIALLGLLVGPQLAEVHWWHGWSPVSILYAVPAPWAMVLLASLVMPVIVHVYLAGQELNRLEPPPEHDKPRSRGDRRASELKFSLEHFPARCSAIASRPFLGLGRVCAGRTQPPVVPFTCARSCGHEREQRESRWGG